MNAIEPRHRAVFQQELQDLFHHRTNVTLWFGITLFPLFGILDYIAVHHLFNKFLVWRVIASLIFLFLLYFNHQDKEKKYPFAIITTSYFIAGGALSAMVIQMGGYPSFYYIGLVLTLVLYAALLPLTGKQTLVIATSLLAIYAVPIFIFSTPSEDNLKVFLTNCFFFITFIIIIVVHSSAENKARITEFNLRMKEKDITAKLSFYADKLEDDVKVRANELLETEKRYQDLYENIIDIVLLVDQEGTVLMANSQFYKNMGLEETTKKKSLLDFVYPHDIIAVKTSLFGELKQGKHITDFQFKMQGENKKIIEAECDATVIKKEGVLVGFQLLIRDITTRKRLEEELVNTFKTVQETRNVTILGLAKLSEYRDTHDDNHLERLREYCQVLVSALAEKKEYRQLITPQYIDDLYHSSILHDIGKVGIPDSILLKNEPLTDEEKEIIKQHPIFGGDTLKAVNTQATGQSYLAMGKSIAYFHHERWDGSGYPYGLKEEEIPLAAHIVGLADTYDDLTTSMPLKPPYSHKEAEKILTSDQRHLFAPKIIAAFIEKNGDFEQIRKNFPEKRSINL